MRRNIGGNALFRHPPMQEAPSYNAMKWIRAGCLFMAAHWLTLLLYVQSYVILQSTLGPERLYDSGPRPNKSAIANGMPKRITVS